MKLPGKRAKQGSRSAAAVQQAQSEDVLRLRARRRLIGAVALVLTGVVVFPLIFETQPKPVASNIALVIPPQNQASSVARPAAPASPAAATQAAQPVARSVPQAPAAQPQLLRPQPQPQAQPRPQPQVQPQSQPQAQPQPAAQANPPRVAAVKPAPARPAPRRVESARQALAALEDKAPSQIPAAQAERAAVQSGAAASPDARFVVQAGAYADAKSAQQVRRRIEAAGLKTYTQVVDTRAGKRVRVRVGPFASRSQAEQVLRRIEGLGIHAAVLGL